MSVSPAKPLCDTAAELTFELDKVLSVFRAVLYRYVAAVGTNQLFSFK
jgi:hypothetical protein